MSKLTSSAERQFHLARKHAKAGKCRSAVLEYVAGATALSKAMDRGDNVSRHNMTADERAQGELFDACVPRDRSLSGLGARRRRRMARR